MNVSLRKAGTLLVAGLAFAACSTDSNDSPLTPPLGLAPVFDGFISIKVCKVIIETPPPGELAKLPDEDVEGVGDEVFFEASTGNFSLLAGNGTGPNPVSACTDDSVDQEWKTDEILVPYGDDFSVTEIAATGSGGTVAISSVSLIPFNQVQGCVDLTGMTATLTDVGNTPCTAETGEPYKLIFKNIYTVGEDGGFEGCTPGAWRNQDGTGNNGKNRWDNTPYTATGPGATLFEDAMNYDFPAGSPYDGITLREALDYNANSGGEALIKHAAAALLNASVDDALLDYAYSVDMVQQMFQEAWDDLENDDNATKDMFDEANNAGCTI